MMTLGPVGVGGPVYF